MALDIIIYLVQLVLIALSVVAFGIGAWLIATLITYALEQLK